MGLQAPHTKFLVCQFTRNKWESQAWQGREKHFGTGVLTVDCGHMPSPLRPGNPCVRPGVCEVKVGSGTG